MSKPSKKQGTTDRWKDSLGQEFRPGDMIAVAVINGRSPQMVIAVVERINTTNAKGEPHTKTAWTGDMESFERENKTYVGPDPGPQPVFHRQYGGSAGLAGERQARHRQEWQEWHARKAELEADPANWDVREPTVFWREVTETVPTVTVTAKPILDGRGFYRSGSYRRGTEKDQPEPDNKSVTYMFIGNIVKLPEHLTKDEVMAIARRPVEYPPSWGW